MSSPRFSPLISEAASALRYSPQEKRSLTKTALTFIVAGAALAVFTIAAWISGPAPEIPAMLELDEVGSGEEYRAGDLTLRLEAAYLEPTVLGDGTQMVFLVDVTNHADAPYRLGSLTRPVLFSALRLTVEEAVAGGFEPDRVWLVSEPGPYPEVNPGTTARAAFQFGYLEEEDIEFLRTGQVRVYFQSTRLAEPVTTTPDPEWSDPVPAAWLVTGIEDRR
ncbi:MAG: hypothetical protein Q4G64_03230 [bacterium]|nr:hypothetical protein [bacterium]